MKKLKVCGLRDPDNLEAVLALQPDFVGFIFYVRSSRFVGGHLPPHVARQIDQAKKVGVFVDEAQGEIEDQIDAYGLDLVQLHGKEHPSLCASLRRQGVGVIKVFSIEKMADFDGLAAYQDNVDYFLFDTKGELPGGNGVAFDWHLLQHHSGDTPYFLSGGIGPEHASTLRDLDLPGLFALDINSKFEIKPGLKDTTKIQAFQQAQKRPGA